MLFIVYFARTLAKYSVRGIETVHMLLWYIVC